MVPSNESPLENETVWQSIFLVDSQKRSFLNYKTAKSYVKNKFKRFIQFFEKCIFLQFCWAV